MRDEPQRLCPVPIFRMGFRPFYLLAAVFGTVAFPVWQLWPGRLLADGYLTGSAWHTHEMVFGLVAAGLTGLLLTAVPARSSLPPLSGARLAALVGLWVLGRILVVTGPAVPAIAVDCLFLVGVSMVFAGPAIRLRRLLSASPALRPRFYRLLLVVAVPALLALANLLFHLNYTDLITGRDATLAQDLSFILIALSGGRLIPDLIPSLVPGARPRQNRYVDLMAFGSLGVLALAGVAGAGWLGGNLGLAAVAMIGAVAHSIRLWLWDPTSTLREPLLWVLVLSYAWLPVSLVLHALGLTGADIPETVVFYGLKMGAMSGMLLGMMTRSAQTYTGRAISGGQAETATFVLVHLAAVVRVFGPLVIPEAESLAVTVSVLLWSGAFLIFLGAYWRVLTQPGVGERPTHEERRTDDGLHQKA